MSGVAQRITAALGGRWYGRHGLAFCPAHANIRTPALSLSDGDGGRLLAYCHAGCSFGAVLEALRDLGFDNDTRSGDRASVSQLKSEHDARQVEEERRRTQAIAVWREAEPISGTIAEEYLRGRGICCPLRDPLRFHPMCWHGPSARRLPAMVAFVEGCAGAAIHRTYLSSDGRSKAPVPSPRMMLGKVAGGAVRVVEADGPLVVAEGIETALSLCCGVLAGPATIWAALSAAGMAGLALPDRPRELIVATDGDDAGRAAGRKLAERAVALGWEVAMLPASDNSDWNDVVVQEGESS